MVKPVPVHAEDAMICPCESCPPSPDRCERCKMKELHATENDCIENLRKQNRECFYITHDAYTIINLLRAQLASQSAEILDLKRRVERGEKVIKAAREVNDIFPMGLPGDRLSKALREYDSSLADFDAGR